jgi:hypothetical protein
MKKQELKKILKPLIKECIKEVIFEGGILSSVVSEVIQGLGSQVIREDLNIEKPVTTFSRQNVEIDQSTRKDLQERRSKLEKSVGSELKGIFENIEPTQAPGSGNGPLSGYSSGDAGVDISGILSIGGSNWKNMI